MSQQKAKKKTGRRRPDLDSVYTINADGSRNFLHPADVKGRWQRRKNLIFGALLLIFLAMPWIQVGGKPIFHIDLPGRAAQLFGSTFTNQDFHLAFFIVTGIGFALFVVTSLWGRVWCGYVCPQTVFMEGVIRKIERWIEGPRNQRIRRNLGPWTFDKAWRKALKHILFIGAALVFTHTFLSYFIPARELSSALRAGPAAHPIAFFWTMFWTAVLYFDFAWFREQTCLIICPYGRLQSTLVDPDTIIIGYDEKRGEPRAKGIDEGGHCVDCYRCVEVCPTGIDIRNGLQMECVGCANCIDACDEVMLKIGKSEGLVRYDSQRAFETGVRRFRRPRVWIYLAMGLVGLAAFSLRVSGRTSFQANALRSAGMPFTIEAGKLRNVNTVHVQNKTGETRRYRLQPAPETMTEQPELEFIVPQPEVELDSFESAKLPVFVDLDRASYSGGFELFLTVTDVDSGEERRLKIRFRGP